MVGGRLAPPPRRRGSPEKLFCRPEDVLMTHALAELLVVDGSRARCCRRQRTTAPGELSPLPRCYPGEWVLVSSRGSSRPILDPPPLSQKCAN